MFVLILCILFVYTFSLLCKISFFCFFFSHYFFLTLLIYFAFNLLVLLALFSFKSDRLFFFLLACSLFSFFF